jgi:hypothetical protein
MLGSDHCSTEGVVVAKSRQHQRIKPLHQFYLRWPGAPTLRPQKSPVRGPLSGPGPARGPGEPPTPPRHSGPSVGPQKSPPRPSGTGAPTKPPSGISSPTKAPASAASSRLSNFDFLNTTSDEEQPGPMPPSAPPMMPSAPPPMPPTPAPMQQQGLPSVGDMEPNWGHGSGESHL